jgi:hypothetical protein
MKAGTERLDVTNEELVALVEGARAAVGEAGYQKLHAAIRTLGYVTELLETRQAARQSVSAARPWRVGADQRAGAHRRNGV